jgi:hypothetical protein
MAIEQRGAVSKKRTGGNVSSAVGLAPTGLEAGDFVIMWIFVETKAAIFPTIASGVAGWTEATVGQGKIEQAENQMTAYCFFREWPGGALPTITLSEATGAATGAGIEIVIAAIKKGTFDKTTPVAVQSSTWKRNEAASAEATTTAVNVGSEGCEAYVAAGGLSIGLAVTAGWTEEGSATDSANWHRLVEATGNVTFTYKRTSTKQTLDMTFVVKSVPKAMSVAAEDTLSVAEATERTQQQPRAASDSVTVAEAVTREQQQPRAGADSVTISEAAARGAVSQPRAAADSLSFSETPARAQHQARSASDTGSIGESVKVTPGVGRSASDSLSIAESPARAAMHFVRSATDSMTIGEFATITGGVTPVLEAGPPTSGISESAEVGRRVGVALGLDRASMIGSDQGPRTGEAR